MKILNQLIERSQLFGDVLFGDQLGKNEPNTKIENQVYKDVKYFFSIFFGSIENEKTRADVINSFKRLLQEKPKLKELNYDGKYLYRYTKFSTLNNIGVDLEKLCKSYEGNDFNKENGIGMYLCSGDYKPKSTVQSWTSKPSDKNVINNFSHYDKVIYRSSDMSNSIFDDDFTELLKENTAFEKEYEVVKYGQKSENIDVVYYEGVQIDKNFIDKLSFAIFNKYNLTEEQYYGLLDCYNDEDRILYIKPYYNYCKSILSK